MKDSISRKGFLVFGKPKIERQEIQEVVNCLKSGWLSTGPRVEKFEKIFREYIGCRYARALNSCTAGLHLGLIAAGIGPKNEVITTPLTFAATANVIIHVGARPVFVDVDKTTMNIDPSLIEKKITRRTRAILPVHFAGRPCEMDAIMKLARKYNLFVIEDAAHALGAVYRGRKIGNISDLAVFSFYATKNITTGEGGMITTPHKKWAETIEIYAQHGLSRGAWRRYSDQRFKHYQIVVPGYKYNMMDIQAALGIHQIRRVEKWLKTREQIWERYNRAFKDLPVTLPDEPENRIRHARHLYTLLLDVDYLGFDRDYVKQALYRQNIGTGVHFIALHFQPYYQKMLGHKRGDFPNAEYISDRTISLPLSPALSDRDVEDVIKAVKKVLRVSTRQR